MDAFEEYGHTMHFGLIVVLLYVRDHVGFNDIWLYGSVVHGLLHVFCTVILLFFGHIHQDVVNEVYIVQLRVFCFLVFVFYFLCVRNTWMHERFFIDSWLHGFMLIVNLSPMKEGLFGVCMFRIEARALLAQNIF